MHLITKNIPNLGTAHIAPQNDLFALLHSFLSKKASANPDSPLIVALSGGSTPKNFYSWVTSNNLSFPKNIYWTTSDERLVPTSHPDSNFGSAQKLLLNPLNVPSSHQIPWPTHLPPDQIPTSFLDSIRSLSPKPKSKKSPLFHVCLLGLGDDAHIASLFPNSPLLKEKSNPFASINVPSKGPRLTITPAGLASCPHIILLVCGQSKAPAIHSLLNPPSPKSPSLPALSLSPFAQNTTWLLDPLAASPLST